MTESDQKIYIHQRILRADATLAEINNLIEFGYLHTAINRIYYGCFYSVQALIATLDIYPKSHAGILRMFSLYFAKDGKVPLDLSELFVSLFHLRQLADYAEDIELNKENVEKLLSDTIAFVDHVKMLLQQK